MVKNHHYLVSHARTALGLAVVLLVNAEFSALASYKVVLKDGTVV